MITGIVVANGQNFETHYPPAIHKWDVDNVAKDKALRSMRVGCGEVFKDYGIDDIPMFPDLVFRKQGNGTPLVVYSFVDGKEHWNTIVCSSFDHCDNNWDACGLSSGRVVTNQSSMPSGVQHNIGIFPDHA